MLAQGTKLGPYEILSPLGAGGMGEVWKARDTRLDRDVALKSLPADLVADPDRLARFSREAKVLAQLSHPSIAAIYAVEEIDGQRFLAMELAEGEDLSERVRRGPIPIDEALAIAKQIAEALEEAHEKGIVHRDLKPANVRVSEGGKVKLLDFGLAKAWRGEPGPAYDATHSPTLTGQATAAGVILGTAAYMSPEQARGKPIDKRADIWAFGVVLFEMLTGKRLFGGETVSDVLAAVLKSDPDLDALPPRTPPAIRKLLARCLQKDPKRRLHAIADARLELDEEPDAPPGPAVSPDRRSLRSRSKGLLAVLVVTGLVALLGFVLVRIQQRPREASWTGTLLGGPEIALWPRISPDGRTLAFQAMVGENTQVAVMKPESGNWQVLTHKTNAGLVGTIAWSADGNRLYYDRGRGSGVPMGVYSVPVLGGDEQLLVEDALVSAVLPDGSLLVSKLNAERALQLFRFWPDSGRLNAFPLAPRSDDAPLVRLFPDGKEAVVVARDIGSSDQAIHVCTLDVDSGAARRIQMDLPVGSVSALATMPDNASVLVAYRAGDLTRLATIPRKGGPASRPLFTFTESVLSVDVASDGSIYAGLERIRPTVARFPAGGGPAERVTVPAKVGTWSLVPLADGRIVMSQRVSGRSRVVALQTGKDPVSIAMTNEETAAPIALVGTGEIAFLIGPAPRRTIAVASLANGRITRRIPFDRGPIASLAASPDGKTIYCSAGGSIWAIPGEGEPKKVCEGESVAMDPSGRSLLVQVIEAPRARLRRVPLDGGAPSEIALNGPFHLTDDLLNSAQVSRDGRLLVVPLASLDSWFWVPGLIDLKTGRMTRIPTDHLGDYHATGWGPDGRVVAEANEFRSAIWKFSQEKR